MKRKASTLSVACSAALLLTLNGCEAQKSSNPLSPSVAGPIPGVEISAPRLIEPGQGFKFKEKQQPIRLVIENSVTNGVRPITYTFEVATDEGFSSKVFARSGVAPGEGRTVVTLEALELGRAYYWRARAEDGANNSTYSTAAFEVLPKALLTVPTPTSPAGGAQVAERRPTLHINPSQKNDAVGDVVYFYVVATDLAFTQIAASQTTGATSWTIDRELNYGLTHYWKVRATDGETVTDWSATQAFRTPNAPAPSPSPSPSPGPNPGGPCNFGNPQAIVECERAKYGHMSEGQMLEFMRNVARSLNRNGIGGGPYGVLRKGSGHNCGGYSCDIICAGQGTGQRQYDVLGDIDGAQTPGWGGPKTWPDIRVDACEIQ